MKSRKTIRRKSLLQKSVSFSSDKETLDSFPGSISEDSSFDGLILVPKENALLFSFPSQRNQVAHNSEILMKIVESLERMVEPVNVRDDFTIQPKQISLGLFERSSINRRRSLIFQDS